MKYKIVRFYMNGDTEEIKRGLTLKEAKEHCADPETSSSSCQSKEGKARTDEKGPWFDGYDKE